MHPYFPHLLRDIQEASERREPQLPRKDEEILPPGVEAWLAGEPLETMAEQFSLSREDFPPAIVWSEEELGRLVAALEQLWYKFHFIPEFPKNLPLTQRYDLLIEALERETPTMEYGFFHIEFCDFNPESCPFGHDYCSCLKSFKPEDGPLITTETEISSLKSKPSGARKLRGLTEKMEKRIAAQAPGNFLEWQIHKPNKKQSLGAWFGIDRKEFPGVRELSLIDRQNLVKTMIRLWSAHGLIPSFPENLPVEMQFETLLRFWDYKLKSLPAQKQIFVFCKGQPENCPFGEGYCNCRPPIQSDTNGIRAADKNDEIR
ncbi:MAG: hypothetical protein KDD12_14580 [Lewinella sp.]|nr:hypothetical protein [Lewinella sp.]